MSNKFLEVLVKFQNKLLVTVALWKELYKSPFLIVWQNFTQYCFKMLMDSDWPYQFEGKYFIVYAKHISGSITKTSHKLAVKVLLWKHFLLIWD